MVAFAVQFLFALAFAVGANAENSCAARQMPGQSVVCVCTAEHCDEVVRDAPAQGNFVAYTSSESGLRFNKSIGDFADSSNAGKCSLSLNLNPDKTYQTVQGFGGSVTDAAAINWKNLSDPVLMQKLIDSYYGEKGLEYNMLRVPIGGCDFSTHSYAYNELPEGDAKLSNFSLTVEDYDYKIPMIKALNEVATSDVHIVATTWSPPAWMKTNDKTSGFGRLKEEYFQTYADYHIKFMEEYAKQGVKVWALTTTNEPSNGILNLANFNTLGWTPADMGKWILNNFGPTIRNSTFNDTKILTSDDQRLTIPVWFNVMVKLTPKALDYIDGVAIHWYTDKLVPPATLEFITKSHPDKFILATEACEGSMPWQKDKVLLGSWDRAKSYILDIIEDLNYNLVGWIDWNLCLNSQGGPNWSKNYVDSPIIVFPERKEFVKQPMYYAMGHVSKFIPRGSVRIESTEKKSFLAAGVENVAFLTPRNTVVAVLYNNGGERDICLNLDSKTAKVTMAPKSIVTVEIPYEK